MRAIVFVNGVLNHPETALSLIRPDDLIIAADGGSRHTQALGIMPDILVGDMDSVDPRLLGTLEAAGREVLRYPTRKDFNDMELALKLAKERGAEEILVIAALGARWDHTLVNLLLPVEAGLSGLRISLIDGPQEILTVRGGHSLVIRGQPGDTVSLIPLGGDARGTLTQGLEYPLNEETLFFGSSRGVSNVLVEPEARVRLQEGVLLCVIIHQAPLRQPQAQEEG